MPETTLSWPALAASFLMLVPPLVIAARLGVPVIRDTLVSTLRMTAQLLLVGVYLGFVFRANHPGLTLAWVLVMLVVADGSILRGCGLSLRTMGLPIFGALVLGTVVPLLWMLGAVVRPSPLWEARVAIPLCGMIMGNCLKANIVGLRVFFDGVRKRERVFLLALAQGATRREALQPFMRDALQSAMAPTLATMATTGLVALPGMMTGVILGGISPAEAIKYQLMIMLAILCATALTVTSAILLALPRTFAPSGVWRGDQEAA